MITILVGIPCSGKSTLASKLAKQNNAVIIEADQIRKMLVGTDDKYAAFNPKNESMVWKMHNNLIDVAIDNNSNIIISNTNCNLTVLKNFCEEYKEQQICFKVLETSLDTCIERLDGKYPHMIPIMKSMLLNKADVVAWIKSKPLSVRLCD